MDKSAGRPGAWQLKLPQTPKLPITIFPSFLRSRILHLHAPGAPGLVAEVTDIFFAEARAFICRDWLTNAAAGSI